LDECPSTKNYWPPLTEATRVVTGLDDSLIFQQYICPLPSTRPTHQSRWRIERTGCSAITNRQILCFSSSAPHE
jgi:hypothetical protein